MLRCEWYAALSAAHQIGKRFLRKAGRNHRQGGPRPAAGSVPRCLLLFGVAVASVLFTAEARANGLRIAARIEYERSYSLVPMTRNFKMCFKQDETGAPVLTLCTGQQERAPAADGRKAAPKKKAPRKKAPKKRRVRKRSTKKKPRKKR